MKNEEAKKIIDNKLANVLTVGEEKEALEIASKALYKQIPKKRIIEEITEGHDKGMHHYFCPVCYEKGNKKAKYNVGMYCTECGQRLGDCE